MAEFARVNPVLATNDNGFGSGRNHNELYSTLQLKAFVVDAGASLAAQTGFGGAIEALTRELGTTAMLFESNGTAGKFVVIGDGHAIDAAVLQSRIRQLGTVNSYDFSGATVAQATSLFGISNA
jgi:hypothetical protein